MSLRERFLPIISEVLHYVWDPISIAGEPRARDEYDSYVEGVFALLEAGASEATLAEHLDQIASTRMGLQDEVQSSTEAARVLIKWRTTLANPPRRVGKWHLMMWPAKPTE